MNGAWIDVYDDKNSWLGTDVAQSRWRKSPSSHLNRVLDFGQTIRARQRLCSVMSEFSTAVTVACGVDQHWNGMICLTLQAHRTLGCRHEEMRWQSPTATPSPAALRVRRSGAVLQHQPQPDERHSHIEGKVVYAAPGCNGCEYIERGLYPDVSPLGWRRAVRRCLSDKERLPAR